MIERPRYIDRIAPFIDQDVVKVLTGMRRSGKSTLLEQIRQRLLADGVSPDALVVRNFESARWADVDSWRSFYDMAVAARPADGSRTYYFFDEVQVVPGWERAVSALRVDVDCDIFLTGSNAKLLAGELATLLSG
jgi:predicted AAA+ superfamily ATPase